MEFMRRGRWSSGTPTLPKELQVPLRQVAQIASSIFYCSTLNPESAPLGTAKEVPQYIVGGTGRAGSDIQQSSTHIDAIHGTLKGLL